MQDYMECYERQTGTYTLKQQLFFNQFKRPHPTTTTKRPTEEIGGLEVKKNVHCEGLRIQWKQEVIIWSCISDSKFHNSPCKNFCRMTMQQLRAQSCWELREKHIKSQYAKKSNKNS